MDTMKEKGDNAVRDALRFVVIFVGLVVAASLLSLAASTNVFLIGAAFVALAFGEKESSSRSIRSRKAMNLWLLWFEATSNNRRVMKLH